MTVQLPLSEKVLETAKQKLGSLSLCLNDSAAFAAAVNEFDEWLAQHKDLLARTTTEQADYRLQIEQLICALTRQRYRPGLMFLLWPICQVIFMASWIRRLSLLRPITADSELTKTALVYDSEEQGC